jgi:hypothetical protein
MGSVMKKTSGELIARAIENERGKLAAEERKRILGLLKALGRAYVYSAQPERQQAIVEAIKTIERNS